MPFQTAFTRAPAIGFEGMIADSNLIKVHSKVTLSTIAPGRVVRIDAAAAFDVISLPTSAVQVTGDATNAPPIGVTMADVTALTNPYVSGDPVPVMHEGCIYVICESVVDPSLPVYIRHTANGGNTIVGGFSAVAGTGLALAPSGYRWMSKTTAVNGLAKLVLSLP